MGKIDKLRECPAVGRRIKPVECGQNRGKNYACPPGCPHCPWAVANYDAFLDIEGAIDTKTLGFYIEVVGESSARKHLSLDALHNSEEGELIFQSACYREFFHREIQAGKRIYDLWREAGWKGLTRDEPFVAGFKAKVRPTLLEVRRVIDDLQIECADLLDESAGTFVVCDRGMAKGALQFQCLMGWVATYPFFSRMHGTAYTLPPGDEPGLELVRRHVRKLGGPKAGPIADWLFENFFELHEHIMEECQKSMKAMFEKESVSDLAKQSWPEHENEAPTRRRLEVSSSLVPEGIEDVGAMMQEVFRSHYKKFLDDRIPALDNMTPREAARRPEMRDRMVALMKGHLQTMDGHSKKDGRLYDIGWVLEELGLGEMKVPARAVSGMSSAGWWEELDDEEFGARLQAGIADPEKFLSIGHFPELADYIDGIDAALLNRKERDSLILMINCTIATVIPEGIAPDDIEEAEMIRETQAIFEQIIPKTEMESNMVEAYGKLIEISAQPAVLSFASNLFMSATSKGMIAGLLPFGKRVRAESIVPMLVQLEAFLRCLRKSGLG